MVCTREDACVRATETGEEQENERDEKKGVEEGRRKSGGRRRDKDKEELSMLHTSAPQLRDTCC